MNRGMTSLLAATCLLLTSITAHAKTSSTTTPVHHRHHAHQASRASFSLDEPGLRSSAALVLDETHSTVLYSRHADVAMPIASISKLVTALTVADARQPMDEVIEITDEDRAIGNPSQQCGEAAKWFVGVQQLFVNLVGADIHLSLIHISEPTRPY